MGSIQDYLTAIGKSKSAVHDPWAHAQHLLRDDEDIPLKQKHYNRIAGRRVILSNIGDDHLMLLNQTSNTILTAAYDAASREEEFVPVFEFMFYSWTGGLTLTRAFKGNENKRQYTPGGGYTPMESADGFGEDLGYGGEQQQGGGTLMDKLRGIKPPQSHQPRM